MALTSHKTSCDHIISVISNLYTIFTHESHLKHKQRSEIAVARVCVCVCVCVRAHARAGIRARMSDACMTVCIKHVCACICIIRIQTSNLPAV
jgi:hypothetical protein